MFFRGFLLKRLKKYIGDNLAIISISIIFALLHNLLFSISGENIGLNNHFAIFIFTFIASTLLGIVNEKIFNGSIIPSFILHGLGNFINALMKII